MLMNSKMLYPPPEREEDGGGPSTKLRSNSYESFRLLDTRIEEGLRGMAEEEQHRLESDPKGVNGMSRPFDHQVVGSIWGYAREYREKLMFRSPCSGFSLDESLVSYVLLLFIHIFHTIPASSC